MPNQPTISLTATQFTILLTALNTHLTWIKPAEKPRRLTLTQTLKITLISYRQNITQETLAHLAEVSQTISTIDQALEKTLNPLINLWKKPQRSRFPRH